MSLPNEISGFGDGLSISLEVDSMKISLKSSGLAFACAALTLIMATAAIAQNPCDDADGMTALDAKVRDNYLKIETLEIALESGKEYLKKYGECPDDKLGPWVKPQIAGWEKRVADYKEYLWRKPRLDKFDAGIRDKKFDDAYSAGAELVQRYPDNVNYSVPLGLIGLYESYKNNFKYNDDSIKYAKMAIAKLKNGTPEPKKENGKPKLDSTNKEVFGAFQFERNKDDAISELTYALAYITYQVKKDKKAGLAYYYEVSKLPGLYKEEPRLYATVGQYFRDEATPIGKEIVDLIEKQKLATTDEEKTKLDVEIKEKEALFNGYQVRVSEAFSKAYKFSDEKLPTEKALKAQFSKILKEIYGSKADTDVAFAGLIDESFKKPFQDPAVAVTPVAEPESVATVTAPSTATAKSVKAEPGAETSKTAPVVKTPAAKTKAPAAKAKPTAAKAKPAAKKKPRR